jgi:hypothetical protein
VNDASKHRGGKKGVWLETQGTMDLALNSVVVKWIGELGAGLYLFMVLHKIALDCTWSSEGRLCPPYIG